MEATEYREYKLRNKAVNVDLVQYASIIINTIHTYAPEVNVTVLSDRYVINKKLSQSQAVKIGRDLAKTELGCFCYLKPVLFKSNKMKNNKEI